MATFAPSAARRLAIAAPMPREPPVISAIFPSSFLFMTVFSFRGWILSVSLGIPLCDGALEHRVGVIGGGRHGLQHIPMLDNLTVGIEAEDIDTSSFLTSPVQIAHLYKGQIAINGDTFYFAGNAPSLLNVVHDVVEPIRKKADCAGCMARTRDLAAGQLGPC